MAYPYATEIITVGPVEVTVAMQRLGRKKLTLTQIVKEIKRMYAPGGRGEVPVVEVGSSLGDLVAQGDVVRKGNYYSLEHDIFEKMERIEKKYNL